MKKVLLAGAALLAVGAASAHAAEPLKLELGGFMMEWVDYAGNNDNRAYYATQTGFASPLTGAPWYNNTSKAAAINQRGEGKISFKGSTKLDNGITIAVQVDTIATQNFSEVNGAYSLGSQAAGGSANQANTNVTAAYATIGGGFGQISLGERPNVAVLTATKAPDVGFGAGNLGTTLAMQNPITHVYFETFTDPILYDSFAEKITYLTPSFYGFQAGVSYVPNISLGNQGGNLATTSSDTGVAVDGGYVAGSTYNGDAFWEALTYNNKFGDLSVKANVGAGQLNIATMQLYSAGLQFGYGAFTLGGSFLDRHLPNGNSTVIPVAGAPAGAPYAGAVTTNAKGYMHAGTSWDVGVKYANGPYAASFSYIHDSSSGSFWAPALGAAAAGDGTNSTSSYALSGAYTMGPGVVWKNTVGYTKFNVDGSYATASAQAFVNSAKNEGVVVISGIMVAF